MGPGYGWHVTSCSASSASYWLQRLEEAPTRWGWRTMSWCGFELGRNCSGTRLRCWSGLTRQGDDGQQ